MFLISGCGDESSSDAPPDVGLEDLKPRELPAQRSGPGTTSTATRAAATPTERQRLGTSAEGRPISAYRVGDPAAPDSILAVGCVHGDEPAGIAITRRLRSARPPDGVAMWLVDEFNPDGCEAGTRQNANGVDLNRNSSWRWKPLEQPGDTYYSGTAPLSEPESVVISDFVATVQPEISIWYHQHAELVDMSGGDEEIERRYAELVGLPYESFGRFPGSITSWQNAEFPADTAFVVELPAGALSAASVGVHADAVLALARDLE